MTIKLSRVGDQVKMKSHSILNLKAFVSKIITLKRGIICSEDSGFYVHANFSAIGSVLFLSIDAWCKLVPSLQSRAS
jgi:hypothetical protein